MVLLPTGCQSWVSQVGLVGQRTGKLLTLAISTVMKRLIESPRESPGLEGPHKQHLATSLRID